MHRDVVKDALRIVSIYAMVAAVWILVSDSLVVLIFKDPADIEIASMLKGWLFILVTSWLLFGLIGRLLQKERALELARDQDRRLVAELLDNSPDAIFAKDLAGRYILASRAVLEIFRKPAGDVLGHDDTELFPASQAQMLRDTDAAAIAGDRVVTYEEALQTARGEVVYSVAKGPLHDAQGKVTGVFGISRDISRRKTLEQALGENNERLNLLLDHAPAALAMLDADMCYLAVSQRWIEDYGLGNVAVIGRSHYDVFPEIGKEWQSVHRRALSGEVVRSDADRFVRADGSSLWLRWEVRPWRDGSGRIGGIVIFSEDITRQRIAEAQLKVTARVFEQAGEAIMIAGPDSVIQSVNAAFCRISGYSAKEAVGQPTTLLRSGRHTREFYREMWQALGNRGFWQGEIWNRRRNGDVFPEWLTITRVDDDAGEVAHYVAVFSDISQIKESQRKVEFLATHDVLTELPNRALFHDRLDHALLTMRRSGTRLALLFIDLDNFKTINDSLGHDVGDILLQQMAGRLREALRDIDTLARLGGDEFTAIIGDCTSASAYEVAERVIAGLAVPFAIGDHALVVSASIGIAMYPEDGEDASNLIRSADAAMYRAKEQGRNRVEFFVPDLRARLVRRAVVEAALRDAMTRQRLRLVFQPKVAIEEGYPMVGAEALLRWHDPQLGDMSPAEFIPIAEQGGLIVDLGRAVQRLLLEQIAIWSRAGLRVPAIAFNVSPRSIREPHFAGQLAEQLREFAVSSSLVQVEITEGALLENSDIVVANLQELARLGIPVAIDDFGTGYSSLGYLKRLPLSELKIDKSFVAGLGADREDEAIARAILALARALELETVAEGVETAEQLCWLDQAGCGIAQGYFFDQPLEAADFAALIGRVPG